MIYEEEEDNLFEAIAQSIVSYKPKSNQRGRPLGSYSTKGIYGHSGQCIECGSAFLLDKRSLDKPRYCSVKCRWAHHGFSITGFSGQCKTCGKTFLLTSNGTKGANKRFFCSYECTAKIIHLESSEYAGHSGQCITCGTYFPLGHGRDAAKRFCSTKCSRPILYIGYYGQCIICGKSFLLLSNSILGHKYCSHSCRNKHGTAIIQLIKNELEISPSIIISNNKKETSKYRHTSPLIGYFGQCKLCGLVFELHLGSIHAYRGTRFCSPKCRTKYNRDNNLSLHKEREKNQRLKNRDHLLNLSKVRLSLIRNFKKTILDLDL
jgi:hypothetical protein